MSTLTTTLVVVLSFCHCLRLSESKTFGKLVWAAIQFSQAFLAQLGRTLAREHPVAVKQFIKHVGRFFIGNFRIEPIRATEGLIPRLLVSLA